MLPVQVCYDYQPPSIFDTIIIHTQTFIMKKNKDYSLLLLLIVIGLAVLASSCGSQSGKLNDGKAVARVKQIFFSTSTYQYLPYNTTELKWVDTGYEVGDTITLINKEYVILNFVNDKQETENGVNIIHKAPTYSDYEITIAEDTLLIFDGNRFVGKIAFTDDSEIGALLYRDNE